MAYWMDYYEEGLGWQLTRLGAGWSRVSGTPPASGYYDTFAYALNDVLHNFRNSSLIAFNPAFGTTVATRAKWVFEDSIQTIDPALDLVSWRDNEPGGQSRIAIQYVVIATGAVKWLVIPPRITEADYMSSLTGGPSNQFDDDDDDGGSGGGLGGGGYVITDSDLSPCFGQLAQLWRIERRDGQVFAFTSHDQPIKYGIDVYKPCHSLSASAVELGALLGVPGNAELAGIIADEAISEADLYAGLFDRAEVTVRIVPWGPKGFLPRTILRGITGNLSQGEDGFSMEVLTQGALLQQRPLLQTYTPGCRWELGDARCGVDLEALTVVGSVTEASAELVFNQASRRIFTDSARTEPDGYFDQGRLEWTSGANAGQVSEIKTYAGGEFTLWRPMRSAITAGDEYEARPGCDRVASTCKNKFFNFANYGGFPDVPGRDSIVQTPNAK